VAVKRAGRPRQVQGHARGGDGLGGGSRVGDEDVHAGDYPASWFCPQVTRRLGNLFVRELVQLKNNKEKPDGTCRLAYVAQR